MRAFEKAKSYFSNWGRPDTPNEGQTTNVRDLLQEVVVESGDDEQSHAERLMQDRPKARGSARTGGKILLDSDEDSHVQARDAAAFTARGVRNTPRPQKQRVGSSEESSTPNTPARQQRDPATPTGSIADDDPADFIIDITESDDTEPPPLNRPGDDRKLARGAGARAAGKKPGYRIDPDNERDFMGRMLKRQSKADLKDFERQARQQKKAARKKGVDWVSAHEAQIAAFLASQAEELKQRFEHGISDEQQAFVDVFKGLRSAETIALQDKYQKNLDALTDYYETHGLAKQSWIFASGVIANWLCFGPGNVYNILMGIFGMPVASAAAAALISGFTWQAAQALVDNVRPTSAGTPYAGMYASIAYWDARRLRDHIYDWYGVEVEKYYFEIKNPLTGIPEPAYLSAAEIRNTFNMWKAFRSQFPSDQLSYIYYVTNGMAAALMLQVFGPAITGPLPLASNILNNIGQRLLAGGAAGGLTALTMQGLRELFIAKDWLGFGSSSVVVTKERKNWAEEADYLRPYIADTKAYLANHPELDPDMARKLTNSIEGMTYDLDKAEAKSGFASSVLVEWRLSMATKKITVDRDPDAKLTGNALETVGSFLGKVTCLTPVAIATILTAPMRAEDASIVDKAIANLIINIVLIYPGFCFRTEWGMLYRILLGGARSHVRALQHLRDELDHHIEKQTALAKNTKLIVTETKAIAGFDIENAIEIETKKTKKLPATASPGTKAVRFGDQEESVSQEIIEKAFPPQGEEERSGPEVTQGSGLPGDADPEEEIAARAIDNVSRNLKKLAGKKDADPVRQGKAVLRQIDRLTGKKTRGAIKLQADAHDSSDQLVTPVRRQEDSSDLYIRSGQSRGRKTEGPMRETADLSAEESISSS